MTEENSKATVYRTTIFLSSGTRVSYSSCDKTNPGFIKSRFGFNHLRDGIPMEVIMDGQTLTFNTSNVNMVVMEEVYPGMEYYDDPLDRFVYH